MALKPNALRLIGGLVVAGLVGACASPGPSKSLTPLPMPTVTLREAGPTLPALPEIVARALQQTEQGDLSGATATIGAIPDPVRRAQAGTQFVSALAEHVPAVAASLLANEQLGSSRTAEVELVATKFVRVEPAAALRWAIDLKDSPNAATARRAVAGELVAENPRAALAQLDGLPAGEPKEMLLGFAAAAWARRAPADAESWVRGLPEGERRQRLMSSVGFEMAQTDPKRAIALADALPPGRNRWLLLAASSQTWVAQDLSGAFAWANQLPAGEARDAALAGVNAGLGGGRVRRVAGPTGSRGSRGRTPVGGTAILLDTTSPAFAAWLATQPQYLSPEDAAVEYIRQRANVEPLAVGQWVAGLPGGVTRERAIDTYLETYGTSTPATAAQWLQSLAPSDRTQQRIERIALPWLQANPTAAAEWLHQAPLPPDRREMLLRQAGK